MVTLIQIETFVKENTDNVVTILDENEGILKLEVYWCNSGFHDDEIYEDYVTTELYDISETIKERFGVIIEEDNRDIWDDEMESVIIKLDC